MAKILVVDDNNASRKLTVTLLKFEGHHVLESFDGSDGLAMTRRERPDLIISDILMPSMDGYEFVRLLRSEAGIAQTAVIFYTAYYHESEAVRLAATCNVSKVLTKPSAAQELIAAVTEVLSGSSASAAPALDVGFDREHLELVTNKVAQKAAKLAVASARFEALTELNLQLASERDPGRLLDKVCTGARNLLGGKYAVLAVEKSGADMLFFASGLDSGGWADSPPRMDSGILGKVMSERRTIRMSGKDGVPIDAGLPSAFPPAAALLAAPLISLTRNFGWLCLVDKIGADEFNEEDEHILSILCAQTGRIYENGSLYLEVQRRSELLEIEMERRERVAAHLSESEARFRQLAENIQDVFFVLSGDLKRILYVSPAYEEIVGRPLSGLFARPMSWAEAIHPEDMDRVLEEGRLGLEGNAMARRAELRVIRPDGEVRWLFVRIFPIATPGGHIERVVGVATDITPRKLAEARIENLNRVLGMLSGINSLIVRVTTPMELFQEACRLAVEQGRFRVAWCSLLDEAAGTVAPVAWAGEGVDMTASGKGPAAPSAEGDDPVALAMHRQQQIVCNDLSVDARLGRFPAGIPYQERGAFVALPLIVDRKSVGCLTLITDQPGFFDEAEMRLLTELAGDISFALDHIAKADRLNYLAYYDALTGLANRTFFQERLSQYIGAAVRDQRMVALVVADVDRFEKINETFGRHNGDKVLKQLAERLLACVGDANQIGRIGADQFAAVIIDTRDVADVVRTVEEWSLLWLGTPVRIADQELRLTVKSGIAIFPNDGADADEILKNAESALKSGKYKGEKRSFYTPHLSEQAAETLALETQLRDALEKSEFELHYQPKIDLNTRRLTGVEALIRWRRNPSQELVAPSTFIPLLEETGMIVEVGAWVLRQAVLDRRRWIEMRPDAPRVAVNVSTVQLRNVDFVDNVKEALALGGILAGLDIEVTESLIMNDVVGNIAKLSAIREIGVGIAIDDFGTGYSSMAYLTKLPAETLKIDRSFVSSMLEDPDAMTLVSTIISLAHALKLDVVAEGVESEEQAKILRLLRCDQIQGYLISRPLSFEHMTQYWQKIAVNPGFPAGQAPWGG